MFLILAQWKKQNCLCLRLLHGCQFNSTNMVTYTNIVNRLQWTLVSLEQLQLEQRGVTADIEIIEIEQHFLCVIMPEYGL